MSAILFTASIVSQIIQRAEGLSYLYIFCSVSLRRPIISLIALGKISLFSFLYLIVNVDFISIWYTENSNVFDCLNKLPPSSSSPNSFFLSPSLSLSCQKSVILSCRIYRHIPRITLQPVDGYLNYDFSAALLSDSTWCIYLSLILWQAFGVVEFWSIDRRKFDLFDDRC